jgi:Tfp pilus assembly protein PilF
VYSFGCRAKQWRQGIESTNTRGKVVFENGAPMNLAVRVSLLNPRGTQDLTVSDNQGQFEFRGLVPGDYTVEVEGDQLKFEVSREAVHIFGGGATTVLMVTLKEKKTATESKLGANVVSVDEIGKDVPAKARKEFEQASKYAHDDQTLKAIDHLRKAIAIYPNFMMAHNDLGTRLLEQGNLDEAATEFRRAIELDAKAFNPTLNLGIVLVRQRKFAEAADTLDKALSLESDSPSAKLYLGMALLNTNEIERAARELKAAYNLGGTSYSVALFYLGELYMKKGERALARQAFEAYLHDDPNAVNSAQARKWIGMLQ